MIIEMCINAERLDTIQQSLTITTNSFLLLLLPTKSISHCGRLPIYQSTTNVSFVSIIKMEAIFMKSKRHTPEQVLKKIAEGDKMLNEGATVSEVGQELWSYRDDLAPW